MFELRPILSALLQHKSRAVLVLLQIALTTAIVSNAVFIIDERIAFMNRDTGYAESEIIGFRSVLLNNSVDMTAQVEVDEDILRSIPGVIDAVMINHIPVNGSGSASNWSLTAKEGRGEFPSGVFRGDEHVLTTMGVKIVEGRNFLPSEINSARESHDEVIIINKSLADKMFPNGDALGKTIYNQGRPSKIIAVVGVMQGSWINWSGFNDNVILPSVNARSFLRYMVRAQADRRAEVMAQIEEKLLASYPDRVINRIETFEQIVENSYSSHSNMRIILSTLIVLLGFITVVGIFGLSSFSVNQRTKQIGTRRALGASKGAICRYFMVENALISCIGMMFGFVLALGLNVLLVNEYGTSKMDNLYVLGTMFAIFVLSQASVLIPALRAAQISPALATR